MLSHGVTIFILGLLMKLPRQKFVLFFTFFLFFVFNFNEIYTRFFSCCSSLELLAVSLYIGQLLTHLAVIYVLFFALSYQTILFKTLAIITCLLSTIYLYAKLNYGTVIDEIMLLNFVDNYKDVGSVLDLKLLVYILFLTFIPAIIICLCSIQRTKNDAKLFVSILVLLLLLVTYINNFLGKNERLSLSASGLSYSPVNYFFYFGKYVALSSKVGNGNKIAIDGLINPKLTNSTPKKIILIIGESARADHFSVNGYIRETTPNLNDMKNLVSFKDVVPCSTSTAFSLPCLLSHKLKEEIVFPLQEMTIISIFNNLNYYTSWFSTQMIYGNQNMVLNVAREAKECVYSLGIQKNADVGQKLYDDALLPLLKESVDKEGGDFIILHTMGSHFLYNDRYPPQFKKYALTCDSDPVSDCAPGTLINSYDNTILYTDHFLSEVINIIKDKDAILFYVSDHGQFLGENGIYYHGNKDSIDEKAHRVPMFLWMSDALLKNEIFVSKFKTAQKNSHKKLSHDNLFYSILDCSNIEFTSDKKDLSVCE
jgi:glucan phosphoethanolaminetransferase (alkaline phosphatase superfamily)